MKIPLVSHAAAGPPPVRPLPRVRQVAPDETRAFGVGAALALPRGTDPGEGRTVYVALEPVRILTRGGRGLGSTWEVAGPLLRARVLAAVAPLVTAGWRLGGPFTEAARWDMTTEGGPEYRGCWVRMSQGGAPAAGPPAP